MRSSAIAVAAYASLALGWALAVSAAAPVDTVRIDLNPLIDKAARTPEAFAVNVPHTISSSTQGTWSHGGSTSTWVYSARVPTAISMSFHAPKLRLPPSAVLTVSTARRTVSYRARDISRSGLWGRPMPGDTLNFSLSVDSSDAGATHVLIDSLQAGYRSLGRGVPNHPHYDALQKAGGGSTGCTINYSCQVTTANQGPAHASVALIIGGLNLCSGTLLNDTRADGAPYVLTARHCETGQLGGGNPDAAATVSVYWDAVSPCSGDLGSIYDSGTTTQTGATTVLEQQDAWVLLLDAPPAATDAFYAGWDATGNSFAGGYTIDYALGENAQYVAWNGTGLLEQFPGTTFGIGYSSTFWGVVNSLGNLGAGASGSALFNPNNLVVGSSSLADLPGGPNTAGICPVSPPATPTASSVAALFTALSGIWTSTADPTSSTGSHTMAVFLDPGGTGALTSAGIATQPITLTVSEPVASTGEFLTLNWSAAGAQSCLAWGGSSGDGWAGERASSGTLQITNQTGGTVNYSMSCQIGNQIGAGNATVTWSFLPPYVVLTGGYTAPVMLGLPIGLNWESDVGPCVATGGTAGDGWAGPQPSVGSLSFNVTQAGVTPYTLSCGPAGRTAVSSVFLAGVYPYVFLYANLEQVQAGSLFELNWRGNGVGNACLPSGGTSSDNWAFANGTKSAYGSAGIIETVPGTYTYTMTCSGGGQSSSSSVTVVVTSATVVPPAISLTAAAPQQRIYSPPYYNATLNLIWNSIGCVIDYTSNSGSLQAIVLTGEGASGAASDAETSPGLVTYTLQCGETSATTTIDWVTTAPPWTLSTTTSYWATNVPYPLTWNATAGPCMESGGNPGDGWAGSQSQSGTQSVSESQPGTYVFTLVCGTGAGTSQSTLAVTIWPPSIQIYSTTGYTAGGLQPTTSIVWTSSVGPCTYVDGSNSNAVGVSVAPSGSATPAPAASGTYLFSLSCGIGTSMLQAGTLATIALPVPTTLTASANSAPVDGPITLSWNSADLTPCYATGGTGEAPWIGTLGGTGSLIVTSRAAGMIMYGISCSGSISTATVDYVPLSATAAITATPTASLSASAASQMIGQSISLAWTSKNAGGCVASGGTAGDGWGGNLPSSGSRSVMEAAAGTVTYSITCSGAPPAATASTTVVIDSAAAGTGISGSTGGHGGGGAVDLYFLLILAFPVVGRIGMRPLRRRTRKHPLKRNPAELTQE